jgi:hypothetical protein
MKKLYLAVISAALLSTHGGPAKAQSSPSKIEVGAHFTLIHTGLGSRTEPGFGGRFTFNATGNIAFEAEVNLLPRETKINVITTDLRVLANLMSAGPAAQGLFGVKAGKRFRKFGLFGKVRPGFISYGRTITGVNVNLPPPSGFQYGRPTHFALDLGGVLEFYPSRRLVIRFDGGDTLIRYPARDIPSPLQVFPPPPPIHINAFYRHNFQFSSGIGIRF